MALVGWVVRALPFNWPHNAGFGKVVGGSEIVVTDRTNVQKAHCLSGIDLRGGLEDEAAADRVFVLLDRTAREQIDLAAEDLLDLFVKFEEVTKRSTSLPRCGSPREGAEHFHAGNAMMTAKGREAGLDLVQGRWKFVFRHGHCEPPVYQISARRGRPDLSPLTKTLHVFRIVGQIFRQPLDRTGKVARQVVTRD
jgi:hypothetical protein